MRLETFYQRKKLQTRGPLVSVGALGVGGAQSKAGVKRWFLFVKLRWRAESRPTSAAETGRRFKTPVFSSRQLRRTGGERRGLPVGEGDGGKFDKPGAPAKGGYRFGIGEWKVALAIGLTASNSTILSS